MYAIVDIETTGSYAHANSITEIAIVVFDGQKIIDRYETLVNPHQPIPHFIQSLTGISNALVANAPSFDEVAPKIHSLLKDKVFVAHNVNFDYSFVKHELDRCGFEITHKKMCTVRYARKVIPGYRSYSLGNICRELGIAIEGRHRAGGDAMATTQLFTYLLQQDADGKHLKTFLQRDKKEQNLPLHLPAEQVLNLPYQPGVYYFHDNKGKVIYVGKAKNIKYRVSSHFTNNNGSKQRQEFMRNIHSISYEICGTELMALVQESVEIKNRWPKYNRSQKKYEHSYGLYDYVDNAGYLRLLIEKKKKNLVPHYTFSSIHEGQVLLKKMIADFGLDARLCFIDKTKVTADNPLMTAKKHNALMEKAIGNLKEQLPSFAIIDKGRTADEKSCLLMEQGKFYGMGYLQSDAVIEDIDDIKNHISPFTDNQYIRNLLLLHATKKTVEVISF